MEYRIVCTLANTLLLLCIWAACSVTTQQNFTDSKLNVSHTANISDMDFFISYKHTLHSYIAQECWINYTERMSTIDPENWCEWNKINRAYSYLQYCLENLADSLDISFPNEIAHDYIMQGHKTYFVNCTNQFEELVDPPEHILLALILVPISIIPFLVTLVVCKSKTTKPQT